MTIMMIIVQLKYKHKARYTGNTNLLSETVSNILFIITGLGHIATKPSVRNSVPALTKTSFFSLFVSLFFSFFLI